MLCSEADPKCGRDDQAAAPAHIRPTDKLNSGIKVGTPNMPVAQAAGTVPTQDSTQENLAAPQNGGGLGILESTVLNFHATYEVRG